MPFLSNWKLYVLAIAFLAVCVLNIAQRYQLSSLARHLQSCQADNAAKDGAIHAAQKSRDELNRRLALMEKEAARAHAESQKRMDTIMQAEVSQDCEEAIQWGVEQIHQ
jgi:uncharacterized protein YlxW (UPF0749 family)